MFAVPGWNLAAKALVQEKPKPVKDTSKNSKPTSPSSGTFTASGPHAVSTTPRKRKRNQTTNPQGFNATRKPQTHSSHDSAASPLNKKHKNQHLSFQAEKRNSKQHGRKNEHAKDSQKNTRTGANSEPIGTPLIRPDTEIRIVQPDVQKDTSKTPTNVKSDAENRHSERAAGIAGQLTTSPTSTPSLVPVPPAPTNLTPLQAKMRAKLTSARFRHLNETLYTTSSADAWQLFTNSPDLFAEYHAGFSQQVRDSWPQNPVDGYVKLIKERGHLPSPVNNAAPLPRRRPGTCTIADLGCGDAPLARGLQSGTKKLNLELHNFDLHAPNSLVTKADISALPLRDGNVDIAIFCLSLMGTNWLSFVEEAWRVLRGDGKGEVWVAEVRSRFGRSSTRKGPGRVVDNSVGKRRKPQTGSKRPRSEDSDGDEQHALVEFESESHTGGQDDTDLDPFIDSFQRRGFALREGSVDKTNKMFVTMIFTKAGVPRAGKWKGMKWNGKEYQRIEDRQGGPQRRFQRGQRSIGDEDERDEEEEGKLLKPCVYKLR